MPVGSSARIRRRTRHHGARDADQLLLPPRQLTGVQILLGDNLKSIEHIRDDALPLRARHVAIAERHLEVLVDRQIVEQVIALKHEPDVLLLQRQPVFLPHRMDRLMVQLVLSAPISVMHAEDVEQSRLSRSGRPHDRDELSWLHVEIDAPKQKRLAGAGLHRFLEVTQRDHFAGPTIGLVSVPIPS